MANIPWIYRADNVIKWENNLNLDTNCAVFGDSRTAKLLSHARREYPDIVTKHREFIIDAWGAIKSYGPAREK